MEKRVVQFPEDCRAKHDFLKMDYKVSSLKLPSPLIVHYC